MEAKCNFRTFAAGAWFLVKDRRPSLDALMIFPAAIAGAAVLMTIFATVGGTMFGAMHLRGYQFSFHDMVDAVASAGIAGGVIVVASVIVYAIFESVRETIRDCCNVGARLSATPTEKGK